MTNLEPVNDPVEALKSTFRRHASGVAVITLSDAAGQPVGFTATSVTSLGATPPLISFNVARGSSSWPALESSEYIAMHTLGEENLELAQRMALDHTQRFTHGDWVRGAHNLPIFEAATSILILKKLQIVNVENNAVIIGSVLQGFLGVEQRALLYFQRGYVTPGDRLS